MSDPYPLGKPIRQPEKPKPDVIERVAPGVISRNGKLETVGAPKGPRHAPKPPEPIPLPEVYIFTTGTWDAMLRVLRKQEDDGFPINEWGVM